MYYGRKKGIIMLLVLVLLILLLAVGAFAFVFLGTDLLKSNDEMFFKYMGKSISEMQISENTQLTSVLKLQQQQPYTVEGTLGMKFDESGTYQTINENNRPKLEYTAKMDPIEEKGYAKFDLKANNNNIFSLEYANGNNIYALKSDEIVTAFVGIKNEDLDVFAEKLGYPEGSASEVQFQNIYNLVTITAQEKEHIIETYAKVLKDNIPSTAFTKENGIATKRDGITYDTTGYRLNLTSAQLKNLEIAVLKALKQDSITMNMLTQKARILGLGIEYTEINNLSTKIDELITKIQTDTTEGNDISLIVYVANGEVITNELIIKNNSKYTMYNKKTDNGIVRNLIIENFDTDSEYGVIKVMMVESNTSTKTTRDISIELDGVQAITISIENEGSAGQQYLNTSVLATVALNSVNKYSIDFNQKIQFVDELTDIIELNGSNCAVLNDYTSDQAQALVKSILERVQQVAIEKIAILDGFFGVNTNNDVTPLINDVLKEQEIEAFNSKFSNYAGKISGASLNTLSSIVKSNNENSENKQVVLTVNGINTAGDSKSVDTTKTYDVEMKYNDDGYIYQIEANDSITDLPAENNIQGTNTTNTNTTNAIGGTNAIF